MQKDSGIWNKAEPPVQWSDFSYEILCKDVHLFYITAN